MFKRMTLRKVHIYTGLVSALLGAYLWAEPKWRRHKRRVAAD
jgi:hypothetical protein